MATRTAATNTAGNGPVGERPPKANAPAAKSWVGEHKAMVVGIVVALLGLLYLLRHHAASSAAATDPTATALTTDPSLGGGMASPDPYGTGDPNSVAALMSQLLTGQAGLADALGNLPTALAASSGTAAAASSPAATNPGTSTPPNSTTPPLLNGTGLPYRTINGGGTVVAPPKPRPPVPANPPKRKPTAHHTYMVRRGDTLTSIAARLHIHGGWRSLYSENRKAVGSNPNTIHQGLVLHY